jgi:hypothetical protein
MALGRAGPRLVPRLRRSEILGIDSQPFRAGLTFWRTGPFDRLRAGSPGLGSMAILRCHFFLNLPQASWLLSRRAPRQAGTGGAGRMTKGEGRMTKGRAALTSAAVTEGCTEP